MSEHKTCGFPRLSGISEWTCRKNADWLVVGVHGSGFYKTEMPRCSEHVKPTVAGINAPNSPYPHESLWRVERVEP